MSEDSGTTIKFGAGYDHPWFTARGTTTQQKKQIAEVFGVEPGDKTLAELTVEAALVAIGLTNAANGVGAKPATRRAAAAPATDALDEASAAARSGSKTKTQEIVDRVTSIADKAKQETAKGEPEQAQPEDVTDDIEALIATAASRKALEDIRGAHKGGWTEAHQLQARQRLAELEK
jgi:hypothetical protein